MSRIEHVELLQVDLPPKVARTDAIQSFVTQETPIVRIFCSDGAVGTGYSYTIGTGGSSVIALLRDHLAPRLIGRDSTEIEAIWKDIVPTPTLQSLSPVAGVTNYYRITVQGVGVNPNTRVTLQEMYLKPWN